MAIEQPNTAPEGVTPTPHDADTAARVLDDAQTARTPGGGGLGGAAAADPLGGSGRASGGTTPNSPIDVPTPHGDGDPGREAQLRSLNDDGEPDEAGKRIDRDIAETPPAG